MILRSARGDTEGIMNCVCAGSGFCGLSRADRMYVERAVLIDLGRRPVDFVGDDSGWKIVLYMFDYEEIYKDYTSRMLI
jgi:hypothetical protein